MLCADAAARSDILSRGSGARPGGEAAAGHPMHLTRSEAAACHQIGIRFKPLARVSVRKAPRIHYHEHVAVPRM
jgi:hypothetical protein